MKKKIRKFINVLNIIKLFSLKIIIFLYFISLLLLSIFLTLKNKNIKICLCTSGKEENNYIREFVEHYKNYGVDKIFLYDNNDINGEYFESIITDYIKLNFVKIINYRGQRAKQLKMYQDCYMAHHNNYDWIIFYDIDEYIYLKNYNNIKNFLIQKKFDKCQSIYLNWVIHTDNNLKYYDNRTLSERFPEINKNKNYCNGKTIIRGYMEGIKMQTTHKLDMRIGRCDGFGNLFKSKGIFCVKPDFKYYYINHYQFKSIEEFIIYY